MTEKFLPRNEETLASLSHTEMNIETLENNYYNLETWRREPNIAPKLLSEIERVLSHLAFEITMRKTTES